MRIKHIVLFSILGVILLGGVLFFEPRGGSVIREKQDCQTGRMCITGELRCQANKIVVPSMWAISPGKEKRAKFEITNFNFEQLSFRVEFYEILGNESMEQVVPSQVKRSYRLLWNSTAQTLEPCDEVTLPVIMGAEKEATGSKLLKIRIAELATSGAEIGEYASVAFFVRFD
ncbi:MAG: hypothetical protein Q7S65_03410 [Nanoarchaeota archaeon]|nr:hypothetical protein [Nanoarchaeota archaeon]